MLVGTDMMQLEWRTILEMSRDEVGIAEVIEGRDAHSLNQAAFDLPSRLIAKIYLFRTIFRGSGYSFANDPAFMHVSSVPQYWDNVGEKFYEKYNGIDECHLRWSQQVVEGEPLVGPTGREWHITMGRDNKGNLKIPWTVLTNYPVQGTGADVMMVYRLSFYRRLKMLGIPALLISTVHDSLYIDCEKQYVEAVVNLMYQVGDDLVANIRRTFQYDWLVPLGVEVKIGMNMLDMTEVKRTDK